jgi:membrane dipeptidase
LFPVIDLHIDTFIWTERFGYKIEKRHRHIFGFTPLFNHFDIPRAIEGGLRIGGFGIVVPPYTRRKKERTLKTLNHIEGILKANPQLHLIRNKEDLDLNGKIGVILGVEGSHAIEDDLSMIPILKEKGVRYFTLAHFTKTEYASPSVREKFRNEGLTKRGVELVRELNKAGIIIDLAHISYKGFFDAIEKSEKPPFVSHTGVCGVKNMWRNLSDEQIKAIKEVGGIIGIIFYPYFLSSIFSRKIEGIVRHIAYCAERFGTDFISIGSDFDGFIFSVPEGLEDVSKYQNLAHALLRAGFKEEEVKKIFYDNALRFFKSQL